MSFEFSKGKTPEGKTVAGLSEVEEQNLHSILRASIDRFFGDSSLGLHTAEEMSADVFPEARMENDDTAQFLASLDPEDVERRAYEEAKKGNDAPLLAFLAVSITDQERFLGIEDLRLASDQAPHEYILKRFKDIREMFEAFARGSRRFRKEYRTEDYLELIKNFLAQYERADARRPLTERKKKEMAVLRRIMAHDDSVEGDGEIFSQIMKRGISASGDKVLMSLPDALRAGSGESHDLELNLKEFLIWYNLLEHFEESGLT